MQPPFLIDDKVLVLVAGLAVCLLLLAILMLLFRLLRAQLRALHAAEFSNRQLTLIRQSLVNMKPVVAASPGKVGDSGPQHSVVASVAGSGRTEQSRSVGSVPRRPAAVENKAARKAAGATTDVFKSV